MKLLTDQQKYWLNFRTVKVGNLYMPPDSGFTVYENKYCTGHYVDTRPLSKVINDYIVVKEKQDDLCKVNFYKKPYINDFYIKERELIYRNSVEVIFLTIFSFIPMVIYNLFKK